MGRKRPDVIRTPPSPIEAWNIGQMVRRGWDVVADCDRCRTSLHVDLVAMARLTGPDLILWGMTPRCRSWIDYGDGRCPGRVRFRARSIYGGTWVPVSDKAHRSSALTTQRMLASKPAPDPDHPGGDDMCNNYRLHVPASVIGDVLKTQGLALTFAGGQVPNFAGDVRIGDKAPVVTLQGEAAQLAMTPWAWKSPQGRPVFNFRSDGRAFPLEGRCLIPADGFYEFTAPQAGHTRKTKWLFTAAAEPWFWIAGIIRQDAFAMLTTEPGPCVAPIHDRQVVVLSLDAGRAWLDGSAPAEQLLRPSPAGALAVQQVYPAP